MEEGSEDRVVLSLNGSDKFLKLVSFIICVALSESVVCCQDVEKVGE